MDMAAHIEKTADFNAKWKVKTAPFTRSFLFMFPALVRRSWRKIVTMLRAKHGINIPYID